MSYFGENWGAPMLEDMAHVETPVGVACFHCSEPIALGDWGLFQTVVGEDGARLLPIHRECNLRMVIGSVGHQRRTCSCYVSPGDDQEDGLSLREAALASCRVFDGAPA